MTTAEIKPVVRILADVFSNTRLAMSSRIPAW